MPERRASANVGISPITPADPPIVRGPARLPTIERAPDRPLPASVPADDTFHRVAFTEAQNKMNTLKTALAKPQSARQYAKLARELEAADRELDEADVNLRKVRGEKSAAPRASHYDGGKIEKAVETMEKAQGVMRDSASALERLHTQRQQMESELSSLSDTVRFQGCRCVVDRKAGECRLESIETGRFRAKIDFLQTCAEDCRRWYFTDSIRSGCATPQFLQQSRANLTKMKSDYGRVIAAEKKSFRDWSDASATARAQAVEIDSSRASIAGEVSPSALQDVSAPALPEKPRDF